MFHCLVFGKCKKLFIFLYTGRTGRVPVFFYCSFLVLEQGPSARSLVLISIVPSPFRSVIFVLERERFREQFQGTG